MATAAILDVDGTLVDTNYQHALAWFRAFRELNVIVPIWQIHRHVGMGADHLIEVLVDERFEEEHGDEVREHEKKLYAELIDEAVPMRGARQLIVDLLESGSAVVLASSAKEEELDHYLDLLEVRDLDISWTSSADVDATKPDPDLVEAALAKAGTGEAVMVGDSTWDVEAAKRAGIPTIGVLTGGFSREELEEAGAVKVFESVEDLRHNLKALDP